jgi:hypothetical protein
VVSRAANNVVGVDLARVLNANGLHQFFEGMQSLLVKVVNAL